MISWLVLLICAYGSVGYGYDSGGDQAACGRPFRAGRMYQPPCDVGHLGYCASAGKMYPWHAVKRFVRDNQGLMRRMYGNQRHGHVLRAELKEDTDPWDPLYEWQPEQSSRFSRYQHEEGDIDNELSPVDIETFEAPLEEARFLRDDLKNDDVLNTKFVYSEEPALPIKLAGLKTAPHFRPTTQKPTTTTAQTTPLKTSDPTTSTTLTEIGELEDAITTTTTTKTTTGTENELESTTDTTTEQAMAAKKQTTTTQYTGSSLENTTEVSEEKLEEQNSNSEENEEIQSDHKPNTMLFQDMEQEEAFKKKMHVNYQMKGVNACPVKEEVVAPFWANNTRGEVLALLNMYPFEQYVHWEKCTFEHRQMYCREGCRCEQQYRLHRLLAYDPNNECKGIFSDWFRFPSCCVCKCYDMPPEFRVTSRSPRFQMSFP